MARAPGEITFLTDTVTGDTAAYSTGDQVGGASSSALSWTGVGGVDGNGAVLQVVVTVQATVVAELDLILYNDSFTAGTNNAAFDENSADLGKSCGTVNIPSSAFKSIGTNKYRATVNSNNLAYKCAGGKAGTLYGNLIARGGLDLSDAAVYVGIGVAQS